MPALSIDWGDEVSLDLTTLIETRLLVQANSGGGKSFALRRLLEQFHGKVQHLVIDMEVTFRTLRERYEYLLLSAETEEVDGESHHFDESHVFCPENGTAEAKAAVEALCSRGRARGYCAVLATQRISKLSKDAAAECNNKLIGRVGADVDMKRSYEALEFPTKSQPHNSRRRVLCLWVGHLADSTKNHDRTGSDDPPESGVAAVDQQPSTTQKLGGGAGDPAHLIQATDGAGRGARRDTAWQSAPHADCTDTRGFSSNR